MSQENDHEHAGDEASLFHQGLALFNTGAYFDAHEAWEDAWHLMAGEKRDFYQCLIQCAVALEHVRRGNPRGALMVFERAKAKFAGFETPYLGIDWPALVHALEALLAPLRDLPAESFKPRTHGQSLPIDLHHAPRITLQHDPFANDAPGC